ncbi:hypothetical protein E8E11_002078 [Didymella keratinophila]|nr:hypothetical protein E8E11_002078 [Didymella keratinophila]
MTSNGWISVDKAYTEDDDLQENCALIRGNPPASVCYPRNPNYNEEACAVVRARWFDSTFHASDPVSVDYPVWTNDSCNPIHPNGTSVTGDPEAGERGCNADTYPAYVVNATQTSQIASALNWAAGKNIRVVVKATGHSYTGRSIGAGSLSIWTHNFRGLEYIEDFQPTSCPASQPFAAIRVAAGHTNGEVQAYLSKHNRLIVSGANPGVGIIGWLTGGGHGFLSTTYGMGSDNLLSATIVLPSGKTVVANPCQNSDIFFAIRGGGGGTYGIVTEVVLQTHPSPHTALHTFTLASLPHTTAAQFWDVMGFLHAHMQRLKEGGMQGYYYIVGPPAASSLSLIWAFMLFDKPNGTVEALMAPIEAYLAEHVDLFAHTENVTQVPTYFDVASRIQNEVVANGGSAYGSRLMSAASLADAAISARVLRDVGPSGNALRPNGPVSNPLLIGHMVGCSVVPAYYPDMQSLNPAWRDTLVHLVVVEGWQDGSPQAVIDAVHENVTAKTQKLMALSPNTGAYFNEADSQEPNWQTSFFANDYGRLLKVKRDVDPENVLWCQKCVGSEAYVEQDGRLCISTQEGWDGREEYAQEGFRDRNELRP